MFCKKKAEGKCPFKHSGNVGEQSRVDKRSEMPCKFGANCSFQQLGTCPYKHEKGGISHPPQNQAPSSMMQNESLSNPFAQSGLPPQQQPKPVVR